MSLHMRKQPLFHPSCDKFLGVENLCRRKAAVVVYTLGKNRRICWNEAKIAIILQCRKSKTTRQDTYLRRATAQKLIGDKYILTVVRSGLGEVMMGQAWEQHRVCNEK